MTRCGVQWGVCPECIGEALLSQDGVSRCLRCERVWDTGDREPCPDATVAFATEGRGDDEPLCRSHAECAKRQNVRSLGAFRSQAPVFVIPHDQRWPSRFAQERALLEPLLAPWLVADVEHIGSTAIPGLVAKPIIDIMAPVASLESSRAALPALTELRYNYFPYRADVMHWLCKPSDSYRTHHLHLVPFDSPLWSERIAFRNHLRAHPAVAAEYGDLKRRLADQYRFDREAYTDAKEAFVLRVLKLALH
jgi:GrpB-like predicted nucleotidyltransferase (UPF0157 family)